MEKRPIVIRHRFSGVWIGYLLGPGSFPDLIEVEGRRIWSWSGGRLECSQLAVQGCRAEDRLGEVETVEIALDGLVELRTIKREVVEQSREFPADALGEEVDDG